MKMAKRLLALLLALTMLLALALPAGAAEKQTSPIKKALEQALSSKVEHFGSAYVYPFATYNDATLIKGGSTLLRFRKNPDVSCPNNYIFCLTILRGNLELLMNPVGEPEIIEQHTIPLSDFSTYGNGNALACAIGWAADKRYPVGEYTAMCFTMNPQGAIEDDQPIFISTLHVVNSEIPAEEIEVYSAWDGEFYGEIVNHEPISYVWGTELCLLPTVFPLNCTTSRDNIRVSSSNSSYVSASVEDGYIILLGKTFAAPANITITCGNASMNFDIMFGSISSISAEQGKPTLCVGETDQVNYSPTGYVHTWSSSNPDVLKVNNDGLVTAVAPGTATITLSMSMMSTSLTYTVKPHKLPEDALIIDTAPTATKPVYQIGKCAVCGKEDAINILQPAIFSDTSPNAWYSDHVDYAYEHNIFTGVTANEFKPNQALTRGQMATVLYRIAGSPEVSSACPFTDVPSGRYYYNAILWAAENGIVTGYTDQTFRPDNLITREQIATILYRYVHYTGTEIAGDPALLETFPDADKVGSYAKPALAWAVAEGLITGVATEGTTYLNPKNSATRAQVATILSRYLNAEPTEK